MSSVKNSPGQVGVNLGSQSIRCFQVVLPGNDHLSSLCVSTQQSFYAHFKASKSDSGMVGPGIDDLGLNSNVLGGCFPDWGCTLAMYIPTCFGTNISLTTKVNGYL